MSQLATHEIIDIIKELDTIVEKYGHDYGYHLQNLIYLLRNELENRNG